MAHQPTTAKPEKTHEVSERASDPGEILPAIPAHLDFVFSSRPLLPDEDSEQYDALLRSLVHQVKPTDVIEAIWTKDIISFIWEAKRLRRWREQILTQARFKAAEDIVRTSLHAAHSPYYGGMSGPSPSTLAAGWMTGKKSAKRQVDAILKERGLTSADVTAHGFQLSLPDIERIDQMAFSADQRRDALFREIERKRASFGQQMRAAAHIIDVKGAEAS